MDKVREGPPVAKKKQPSTPDERVIFFRVSEALGERLDRQLERSGRKLKGEMVKCLEHWLDLQERLARQQDGGRQ